jgi:hypothetical protein
MSDRKIANIIAHQVWTDEICYRVLWTTHECEWLSGKALDTPEFSPFVLRYWRTTGRELTNHATQTDPCQIFEFPTSLDDIFRGTRSFVEFPATAKSAQANALPGRPKVPTAIVAIQAVYGTATVKVGALAEPEQMSLTLLRALAPKMIAEYYINLHRKRIA